MAGNNFTSLAIYKSHLQAETVIKELLHSGFKMKNLSIVGCDYFTDEDVVGYYHDGNHMQHWGKLGAFWGGIWGLLFGSAFFFVPSIGPLLMAGPIVGCTTGALHDGIGGMSAIGAGLCRLGLPAVKIPKYETALKTGKFVVIANGTAEEAIHAREIINRTETEAVEEYQSSHTNPEPCLVGA
jgi:hypothetical protein